MAVTQKEGTKGALKVVADATTDAAIEIGYVGSNTTQLTIKGNGAFTCANKTTFTQTYATTDTTFTGYTADAESSAYAGMTSSSDGVVYAKLADLNALRTAYETLRAHVEDNSAFTNSLVDALQTLGVIG